MKRQVSYVKLTAEGSTFLPGDIGDLGSTLPPNGKTITNLNMYVDSVNYPGLLVVEGNGTRGQPFGAFIPLANIKIAKFTEPTVNNA